jgi:drug/metabolite transporter (DMT)-like permease
MDYIQYLTFFGLIFLATVKNLSMKPCANLYPANHTALFFSFWLFIFILFLTPFYINEIKEDLSNIYIIGGLIKGLFLYGYVVTAQKLAKHTGTSRAFVPVVAVGIVAFINYFMFGEEITQNQLISSIIITFFGFFYYLKGHLNETKSHFDFISLIGFAIVLSVVDHITLKEIHWFPYLLSNVIITLLVSLKFNKEIKSFKFLISEKRLLLSAIIYIAFEILMTSARVNILPVTTTNIASLMSTPLVMLGMYLFFNESTMKKQIIFGLGAFFIGAIGFIK